MKKNNIIPKIVKGVAISAVAYGIGKLVVDDDFRDEVKDKIQDIAIKDYEGLEKLEEKMKLYDYEPTKDE